MRDQCPVRQKDRLRPPGTEPDERLRQLHAVAVFRSVSRKRRVEPFAVFRGFDTHVKPLGRRVELQVDVVIAGNDADPPRMIHHQAKEQ